MNICDCDSIFFCLYRIRTKQKKNKKPIALLHLIICKWGIGVLFSRPVLVSFVDNRYESDSICFDRNKCLYVNQYQRSHKTRNPCYFAAFKWCPLLFIYILNSASSTFTNRINVCIDAIESTEYNINAHHYNDRCVDGYNRANTSNIYVCRCMCM